MNFCIREATLSDAEAIWKLNCMEMGYQYPFHATVKRLEVLLSSNHDKIFVAVADDFVVGYVHANDYDLIYAPHMKKIMGIAVSFDHKRKGIGCALLEKVEEWGRCDGAVGVRLVSGASRAEAHAFYRKCGYSGDKQQLNLKKMF